MVTEDYVSFETAKLLKEKGFPQEYDTFHSMVYNEEDYEDEYEVQRMALETKLVKAGTLSSYPAGVPEPKCYCPTLQMAMKWLREEYNIVIEVKIYGKINDKNNLFFYADIYVRGHRMIVDSLITSDYRVICNWAVKFSLDNFVE